MKLALDSSRRPVLAWLVLALSCSGCSSAPAGRESGPDSSAAESKDSVATAKAKCNIAKLELELAEMKHKHDLARLQLELALAQGELAQFDELDAPNRLAKSKLGLARSRDTLAEQEEELAQLVMTYAEVDLADKTREIVLNRNQRRVARAKDDLAIAERESSTLEVRVLPRERAKLALEVNTKTHAIEAEQSETELELQKKRLAVDEAQRALEKCEKEAAKP